MYSLCGLDLGGLWWAVYVCRQSREGIELTEILPSFPCSSTNPTDAIPCPTYLPMLLQRGSLRAHTAPILVSQTVSINI